MIPRRTAITVALVALLVSVMQFPLYAGGQGETADAAVELELWVENTTGNQETFRQIVAAFEESHPSVQISPQIMTWGALGERLTTQFASQSSPDVVHLPGILTQQADRGMLLNIDDYVELRHTERFLDVAATTAIMWEGSYYGLPFIADTTAIMYNVAMFVEAGLPTPTELHAAGNWNWETFLSSAIQLNNPPQRYGFSTHAGAYWSAAWILQAVEPPMSPPFNSEGDLLVDSPAARSGFQFLLDLFHRHGVAAPATPGADYAEATRTFATERSAMASLGTWDIGLIRNVNPDLDFRVVPYPAGPNGTRSATMSINTLAIGRYTEQPDLAWELLNAMLAPDMIMNWTIEGYRNLSTADWGDHPFVRADQYLSVYAEALEHGVLYPYVPGIPDAGSIFDQEVQSAIFEEKTLDQAIEAMKRRFADSRDLSR